MTDKTVSVPQPEEIEDMQLQSAVVAQLESDESDSWRNLPIGHWFFHHSPNCVQRYSVQERTSGGCILVCSSTWHHESARRDMQEIAEAHNAKLASLPVGESTRPNEVVLKLADFPRKFREIARELANEGWCDLSMETHAYADMLQAAIENELGLGESREPLPQPVPCEFCGTTGQVTVSSEMAIDAGNPELAGSKTKCWFCNGEGVRLPSVPAEIENLSSDVSKSSNETRNT